MFTEELGNKCLSERILATSNRSCSDIGLDQSADVTDSTATNDERDSTAAFARQRGPSLAASQFAPAEDRYGSELKL